MAAAAEERKTRYTFEDYCTWPEGQRCELIGGEIHLMAPAPGDSHQLLVLAF